MNNVQTFAEIGWKGEAGKPRPKLCDPNSRSFGNSCQSVPREFRAKDSMWLLPQAVGGEAGEQR